MTKYPDIKVKLIGNDGNAFAILGEVQKQFRNHNIPKEEWTLFFDEAASGDYDNLLATVQKWVEVE